jgi:hypothetical protein
VEENSGLVLRVREVTPRLVTSQNGRRSWDYTDASGAASVVR